MLLGAGCSGMGAPASPRACGEHRVGELDADLGEQVGEEVGLAAVALEGEADPAAGSLTVRAPLLAEVQLPAFGARVLGVLGEAADEGPSPGRVWSPVTVAVGALAAGVVVVELPAFGEELAPAAEAVPGGGTGRGGIITPVVTQGSAVVVDCAHAGSPWS
jgi:hypothetical protein